jgi:hypothetical protein
VGDHLLVRVDVEADRWRVGEGGNRVGHGGEATGRAPVTEAVGTAVLIMLGALIWLAVDPDEFKTWEGAAEPALSGG